MRIKTLTPAERKQIREWCDMYGEDTVCRAGEETLRRGGKSIAYAQKVLDTMVRTERQCIVMTSWVEDGESGLGSMYGSGSSYSEAASVMDDW